LPLAFLPVTMGMGIRRRLLVLTGESPKYTFDNFLHAIETIASVHTEPCGNIRRINVEIPSLSVSDMRRLKVRFDVRFLSKPGAAFGLTAMCNGSIIFRFSHLVLANGLVKHYIRPVADEKR
jgi:hypothetical protein